jgi:hypothetical protein
LKFDQFLFFLKFKERKKQKRNNRKNETVEKTKDKEKLFLGRPNTIA